MTTNSAWTPERRARQAEIIRCTKPWTRSTGPRTAAGKAKSSINARLSSALARHRRRNEILLLLIKHPSPQVEAMLWAELYATSDEGEVDWEQVAADAAMPWPEGDNPFDDDDGDSEHSKAGDDGGVARTL